MKRFASLALFCALSAPVAQASTLGPVSFTTAPARVSIVNEFGPFAGTISNIFAPTSSYTVSVSTTIASAQGLPNLVGQSLNFTYGVNDGFNFGGSHSLNIGGTELLLFPDLLSEFFFSPPVDTITFGAAGEDDTYTYTDPFSDFGPRTSQFPEFLMSFRIDQPLPTRQGYEQCTAGGICEFSFDTPLTEIGGEPIAQSVQIGFIEGALDAGTITFSSTAPITAAVPLPAAGFLLLAGLAGLGMIRRRV